VPKGATYPNPPLNTPNYTTTISSTLQKFHIGLYRFQNIITNKMAPTFLIINSVCAYRLILQDFQNTPTCCSEATILASKLAQKTKQGRKFGKSCQLWKHLAPSPFLVTMRNRRHKSTNTCTGDRCTRSEMKPSSDIEHQPPKLGQRVCV